CTRRATRPRDDRAAQGPAARPRSAATPVRQPCPPDVMTLPEALSPSAHAPHAEVLKMPSGAGHRPDPAGEPARGAVVSGSSTGEVRFSRPLTLRPDLLSQLRTWGISAIAFPFLCPTKLVCPPTWP